MLFCEMHGVCIASEKGRESYTGHGDFADCDRVAFISNLLR